MKAHLSGLEADRLQGSEGQVVFVGELSQPTDDSMQRRHTQNIKKQVKYLSELTVISIKYRDCYAAYAKCYAAYVANFFATIAWISKI